MRNVLSTAFFAAAIAAVVFAAGCTGGASPVAAPAGPSTVSEAPVANDGYDMTAYFALGKAVRGTPQLSFVWNGAQYLFASKEGREKFAAAPEKYLPGFESHCPVSLSEGREEDGDPGVWRIFRDRLYFFTGEEAARHFDRDPQEVLRKAEQKAGRR